MNGTINVNQNKINWLTVKHETCMIKQVYFTDKYAWRYLNIMKLREIILCGLFIALVAVGAFVRTGAPTFRRALAACLLGMVVVYVFGISYFYFASNYIIDAPIGFWVAIWYCGVLQVLPDFLLCVAAAYIGVRTQRAGLWL